jgi:alanine dehydrogenase
LSLVLTRADVLGLIAMPAVINAVRTAHAEHASGRADQPTRVTVTIPGATGSILPMPASLPHQGAVGLKLLSVFPENPARGLPLLSAVVVLVDAQTGRCEAVMDGGALTAYRTAAASAVATDLLARSGPCTLGLIGAGVEARTHVRAVGCVREIEKVLVWSRSQETAARFADEVASKDLEVSVCDDPQAVVENATILCTLTPAPEPIVLGSWFRPGLHVNAVGTHWPDRREIDTDAVVHSRIVVDSRDAHALECGDLLIPLAEGAITADHFADELGEVICGMKPGRSNNSEITMYQSVGVAIQDVATARMLVTMAVERGVGTDIDL